MTEYQRIYKNAVVRLLKARKDRRFVGTLEMINRMKAEYKIILLLQTERLYNGRI